MKTKNVLIAGLGGQGIILCSRIICNVLFEKGYDIKKSEVHGMSQRGGSVTSQIRFGKIVYSPLIPERGIDFLLMLDENEGARHKENLSEGGIILGLSPEEKSKLKSKKCVNVAVAAKFLKSIGVAMQEIERALRNFVKEKFILMNMETVAQVYSTEKRELYEI